MSNLLTHFATPAILTTEMSEAEIDFEFAKMMLRSTATADFVNGHIEADEFLEALYYGGVHVDEAVDTWSSQSSFLF